MLKEHCGVIGAYFVESKDSAQVIYNALLSLQHRGQESFGIAGYKKGQLIVKKSLGLVTSISNEDIAAFENVNTAIAHVRYSTTGATTIEDAQPSLAGDSDLKIALAFNGNLVNYVQLRNKLKNEGVQFKGRGDGEILANLFFVYMKKTKDVEKTIENIFNEAEGAYSATVLSSKGELFAFRDPFGFRPLNIGFDSKKNILIASETVAHDLNSFEEIEPVNPAELIYIKDGEIERKILINNASRKHCMFEFVYFSRPDSILEGRTVYEVRWRLGEELAKTYSCDADVIVPIPDSSRPAAEAISRKTGIPVVEGLIKNRYIGRTFIMPGQSNRDKLVKLKLNPVKSLIKGKKVLLIDDSLVRGTTIKKIVELVRKAGAERVYVWITCPPIISPCFYGIDIAIHGELIASRKSIDEIAKEIGADELRYQTIEGLKRAIGLGENICTACLTGIYPTPLAQKLSDMLKDEEVKGRYWELEVNV